MEYVLVLVGHGVPPRGYDLKKVSRYIELEKMAEKGDPSAVKEFYELDREVRSIPRTRENDPYWFYLNELANKIRERGIFKNVYVAFNEFSPPSIEESLNRAIKENPGSYIIVVPTMIIPGGAHSEKDIPEKISEFRRRYPESRIIYAWPYQMDKLVDFFIEQALRFRED